MPTAASAFNILTVLCEGTRRNEVTLEPEDRVVPHILKRGIVAVVYLLRYKATRCASPAFPCVSKSNTDNTQKNSESPRSALPCRTIGSPILDSWQTWRATTVERFVRAIERGRNIRDRCLRILTSPHSRRILHGSHRSIAD